MELVALRKPALMIPTPGQTEQEYLARHYQMTGLFFTAKQEGLNLVMELGKIENSFTPNMDYIPINDTTAFLQLLSN